MYWPCDAELDSVMKRHNLKGVSETKLTAFSSWLVLEVTGRNLVLRPFAIH